MFQMFLLWASKMSEFAAFPSYITTKWILQGYKLLDRQCKKPNFGHWEIVMCNFLYFWTFSRQNKLIIDQNMSERVIFIENSDYSIYPG